MKIVLTSIILILINSYFSQTIKFKINTSDFEIVRTLFESESINNNECNWKMKISDKYEFEEFENDSLTTSIDTTFSFKIYDDTYKYILIKTQSKIKDCHSCAPNLGFIKLKYISESNEIIVEDFHKNIIKYGSWGNKGELSFFKLSENDFAIKVRSNYSSMGINTTNETIILDGKILLSYISYEDNLEFSSTKSEQYKYTTSLTVDKNYKIILSKKGTEKNQKSGKIVTVNSTKNYYLENGILQQKK